MSSFKVGDRVRNDSKESLFHGEIGTVEEVFNDHTALVSYGVVGCYSKGYVMQCLLKPVKSYREVRSPHLGAANQPDSGIDHAADGEKLFRFLYTEIPSETLRHTIHLLKAQSAEVHRWWKEVADSASQGSA